MKTAEDLLVEKGRHIFSVSVDTFIHQALEVMVENKIGAILVTEDERIVGIWTERDLMRNTIVKWFNAKNVRVGDQMSRSLRSAASTDSTYDLMDKFLGLRLRHLPIEKEGEYIGLLSVGDVLKACLQEKSEELEKLNAFVSWEYHEEWKWKSPGVRR